MYNKLMQTDLPQADKYVILGGMAGIIDSAMDAIITINEKQVIILFNPAAERMFCCEVAQALGSKIDRFIPQRFREAHAEHIRKFGETGETSRRMGQLGEIRGLRTNGEEFPIEASISQVNIGGTKLFSVILRDITERKQLEMAIQTSERKFRAVYEQAPLGIALIDSETGHFLQVNQKYGEIAGRAQEELLKLDFQTITHPDDLQADLNNMELLRKEKIPSFNMEKRYIRPDGSIIWVALTVVSMWSEGESSRVHLAMVMDITERKKNEEQLKQINEELRRSNNDLRDFAYVASHDLKEPLRAVNGFMELLRQRYGDKLDEKAREYINIAVNSTKRMGAMLAGLLEYSRLQTHAKAPALTPAQAAFDAAVTNLRASITETQAVITCDPLPSVKADDTQLVQLFQNLIGNAIKFRSEQRPEIKVGCEKQENHLLFSVRDNGIGINPDSHERIFFIFQQLNPNEKYSGQGIGLAICKKIVERHAGKIWVESQPQKGSTFYFTIPV